MSDRHKKNLEETLGSKKWVEANKEALLNIYPAQVTHQANLNTEEMDLQMERLGIVNKSQDEFNITVYVMEMLKIFKRTNGYLIQRNFHFNTKDLIKVT